MNRTMQDGRTYDPSAHEAGYASSTRTESTDDALVHCTARTYGYSLFGRVFGADPDEETMRALEGALLEQAWNLLASACPQDAADLPFPGRSIRAVASLLSASEYMRLFVGPAAPIAPLWESVYVSASGSLFTRDTLAVRAAYREYGFRACGYPHEADDHLATELTFMAELCSKELNALQAGDSCAATHAHWGQTRFLRTHLLRWTGLLAERLCQQASDSCYAVLAQALWDFLRLDELTRVSGTKTPHTVRSR